MSSGFIIQKFICYEKVLKRASLIQIVQLFGVQSLECKMLLVQKDISVKRH